MVFKICTSALMRLALAGTLAFGLVPSEARATAILDVVDGQLLGARNLDVDGALYDVTFVEGSCFTLFDECDEASDFPINDEATARAAGQALLDQVFIDSVFGEFDSDPSLTGVCNLPDGCQLIIPFAVDRNLVSWILSVNGPDESLDNLFDGTIPKRNDTSEAPFAAYAFFSRTSTSIPEPSTLLLFGLGLVGLGLTSRRRRLV